MVVLPFFLLAPVLASLPERHPSIELFIWSSQNLLHTQPNCSVLEPARKVSYQVLTVNLVIFIYIFCEGFVFWIKHWLGCTLLKCFSKLGLSSPFLSSLCRLNDFLLKITIHVEPSSSQLSSSALAPPSPLSNYPNPQHHPLHHNPHHQYH